MNIGARQGFINRASKSRNSATAGNNKGRPPKLRVGCPECPRKGASPDDWTYVAVQGRSKSATCKNGHTFWVGNGSDPNKK